MFITIYGINNIGKSTHAKRLVTRLKKEGRKAVYVKYPIYNSATGAFLNKVLRGGKQKISEEELQLWFVLNRYQHQDKIKEWLKKGYDVVAEDYIGTGIAWGITKGVDRKWLEAVNSHLLKEDFAILIDGRRQKSSIEKGHIHEEHDALILSARQTFLKLAKRYSWKKVRLQPEKDATEALIWNKVEPHL